MLNEKCMICKPVFRRYQPIRGSYSTQWRRTRDLAIFMTTTDRRRQTNVNPIALPLAHARGVTRAVVWERANTSRQEFTRCIPTRLLAMHHRNSVSRMNEIWMYIGMDSCLLNIWAKSPLLIVTHHIMTRPPARITVEENTQPEPGHFIGLV